MRRIVDINWSSFRTKFNGREREKFEELSYLLFCKEHEQNYGIFGYFNQTGIEKEPIVIDGKHIGFQAKFFETKISENVREIKEGISKAKQKNPDLNVIYYYINKDFSESSTQVGKDPHYKVNIEAHASSKDIEIVWKTPSQFSAQLKIDSSLFSIAEFFFDPNPGLLDAIMKLQTHKDAILRNIKTQIEYSGRTLKIDRSTTINEVKNGLESISVQIIRGEGGVGKTAIVKELLPLCQSYISYVFRANEFSVSSIHDFLTIGGSKIALMDFINEHRNGQCLVVIDSAERLLDIEEQSPFFEFVYAVIDSGWRIIITTRSRYYEDIIRLLTGHLTVNPSIVDVPLLEDMDLLGFSSEHDFALPSNHKLMDLMRIPYYLQAYLDHYQDVGCNQDYKGFFDYLWRQKIMKSQYQKDNIHIRRSECMLKIVHDKANSGAFYIETEICNDKEAISSLYKDEVLGYDDAESRYFIAHDVIEEIVLLRLIEQRFADASSSKGFFESIGCSLVIRRAFRYWLLGKIESEPDQVQRLIGATLSEISISQHWRDEALISILTSTKANEFFSTIEPKLKEKEFRPFYRLVFLLRTACKEYDSTVATHVQENNTTVNYLKYLFTQPRGQGWDFAINFIFKHRETLTNWRDIVYLLHDWTNKYKEGSTTRIAGKTALCKYKELIAYKHDWTNKHNKGLTTRVDGKTVPFTYKELITNKHDWYGDKDIETKFVKVILNSAGEIKNELNDYFESILNANEPRRDRLVETLLTSLPDSIDVVKAVPQYVEKLAWFYWVVQSKKVEDSHRSRAYSICGDFGLSAFCVRRYYPKSAFQTPIYGMLRFHPKRTIDFIIKLMNHSVKTYAQSERGRNIGTIQLFVEGERCPQYIDSLLWNMYRGVSGGAELLQSIHMALEKWLLEQASYTDSTNIEAICNYLLRNSMSASITSVVVSIILAHPEKTFNVAALLFRIPEIFIYDTRRLVDEPDIKGLYSLGYGLDEKNYLRDERLKTCEDEFRKQTLEHIALNYQLLNYNDESTIGERRTVVWDILDEHYANLPPEEDQDEFDRTWRTYLARMDSRKMELTIESRADNKTVVSLSPTIDPQLKEYNEQILSKLDDQNRFVSLMIWGQSRFRQEKETYLKYDEYNKDIKAVLEETKTVLEELAFQSNYTFERFYKDLPAYSCAVLLRDFVELLNDEAIAFCREVIMSYISALRDDSVIYQIHDASKPAIASLPVLANLCPDDMNVLKEVYLCILFIDSETSLFVKQSIQNLLWDTNTEDAWSIMIGYIMLTERYEDMLEQKLNERELTIIREPILDSKRDFIRQNADVFSSVKDNDLSVDDLEDVDRYRLSTIVSAVELLPIKLVSNEMKSFFVKVLPTLSHALFVDKGDNDYEVILRIVNKICPMILSSEQSDIDIYIKPFVDSFQFDEYSSLLFNRFIYFEDRMSQYDNFWHIWSLFFPKTAELCNKKDLDRTATKTIRSYLLADTNWSQGTSDWHSVREKEAFFYGRVVDTMGHKPVVLYSIAKVLNDVGSRFQSEGVTWLSEMINTHKDDALEPYTIYYMENFIRVFILTNKKKIKRGRELKDNVLRILDFLFNHGSTTGFFLREDIL